MTRRKNTSSGEFWYDEAAAERAVGFFHDCLVHTKGEWRGQPLTLAPWQADGIIRPLFGWKRGDVRRYRTLFAMVPRKAGKIDARRGHRLYLLFCDDEPAGEIYGAASDRQQAGIILEMAKAMVAASPALRSRSKVYARSIVVPSTGSSYKVVSSDAYSAHGFSPSGIIFDELHTQPNRELFDALTTGMGARRQPLTVAISTAGYERESLCYQMYEHACKVRDGVLTDDSFLPVIYEAPQDADWTDPETWRTAHPGIGISTTRGLHSGGMREGTPASVLRKQLPALAAQPMDRAGNALDLDGAVGQERASGAGSRWPGLHGRARSQHDN